MIHPNPFQVNEAWIAFQLNEAPIQTGADGDFNCVALMDAASCFILTSSLIPTSGADPSKLESRRLLKKAQAHKRAMPKTLFIPSEQTANNLALEAERQKVNVVRVPEDELLIFIEDTREGFKERFSGGNVR